MSWKNKLKLKKTLKFVFEQFRETSQRKMNICKQQFKNFEVSAEKYHVRLLVFAFSS